MLGGAGQQVKLEGMAANGHEALQFLADHPVDAVLMDLRMPSMDGITATRMIARHYPRIKVIVLTTYDDDELILRALKAGAVGYLLKDVGKEKIIEGIETAMRGDAPISPSVAAKVINYVAKHNYEPIYPGETALDGTGAASSPPVLERLRSLSIRDLEILELIAEGLDNDTVAQHLYISRGTVKNHLSRVYDRLGVSGRVEAVAVFMRCHGLRGNH